MSTRGFAYRLVVLRHGQSEWNAAGLFTGWENAHLTAQGEREAARAGTLLAEHGVPDLHPDAMGGQYLDPHAARDGIQATTYRHTTDPEEVRYEQQARR